MKHLILKLILLTILAGCACDVVLDEEPLFPWFRKKGVTKCCNGIIFQRLIYHVQHVALRFQEERRLKLLDSHIYYDEVLTKVRLDFSSMAMTEFCAARMLLVDLADALLESFESDNILMSELEQREIDPRVLEIYIDFKPYLAKMVLYDYIGWVTLVDGCANYYAFDMRTDKLSWWQYRTEGFFESRAIVRAMREAKIDWDETHKPPPSLLEEERFNYITQ